MINSFTQVIDLGLISNLEGVKETLKAMPWTTLVKK